MIFLKTFSFKSRHSLSNNNFRVNLLPKDTLVVADK